MKEIYPSEKNEIFKAGNLRIADPSSSAHKTEISNHLTHENACGNNVGRLYNILKYPTLTLRSQVSTLFIILRIQYNKV